MDNIFFDTSKLKYVGKNVIIGKTVRIRHPELVSIDDNSIIDDFTYISAELEIGKFCHIASNSTILGGGGKGKCIFEDLTGCAPGCRIITASDDYVSSMAGPNVPKQFLGDAPGGLVQIKSYSILGTNTVVMPNVTVEEGVTTGAMTLVRKNLESWTIYGGNPARKLGPRDKESIMTHINTFWDEYNKQNN
jgi:galactoside O-acetyltransferase